MERAHSLALIAVGWMIACVPQPDFGSTLATEVVFAPGDLGTGNRDAQRAVNGVRGSGAEAGSVDVFSLGLELDSDDVLVLGFDMRVAVDVPGPDLAVFENPFDVIGGGRFLDPTVVEVSADCERYAVFPHRFEPPVVGTFSDEPTAWIGFAGIEPVHLHAEDHVVDPFGPEAGGDVFDFADLDLDDPVGRQVLEEGARCVRLSSAQLWDDPLTDQPYLAHPAANGADIDGLYAASTRRR